MEYKLIISVVPHGSGEIITGAAVAAGAGGGTIIIGRGTAQNAVIEMLGFGDTTKDISYIIVPAEKSTAIIGAIRSATEKKSARFGVLVTVDVTYFTAMRHLSARGQTMAGECDHQVITIIANKGYGDDIMAAARKAGAGGGTIITARGTAKEGDEKFLGMEIVPEKELLYIIAETIEAERIIAAITALDCLSKPGSGIVFAVPAGDFTVLGREE